LALLRSKARSETNMAKGLFCSTENRRPDAVTGNSCWRLLDDFWATRFGGLVPKNGEGFHMSVRANGRSVLAATHMGG